MLGARGEYTLRILVCRSWQRTERSRGQFHGLENPSWAQALTHQSIVCYNLHAGHGQMLRVVGLALGTGWGVLPYSFLSIKPRNSVIWGGSS